MAPGIDIENLPDRLESAPALRRVREAAERAGLDAYLVGGGVRDLLLGAEGADLDVVVEGDHSALVAELGGQARDHERFGTATVELDGEEIDVATARKEVYPRPGALPEVEPGTLAEDLERRDFTVNAIASPLAAPASLVDPHGGLADLEAGRLRALHAGSFVDDPTRALRAARYASRLGFELDSETLELVRAADLGTVSAERVGAELRRLAAEPDPAAGLRLLVDWGLADADPELAQRALDVARRDEWRELAGRDEVLLAASGVRVGRFSADRSLAPARELAALAPQRPSEGAFAARALSGAELVVARALGAEWLDDHVAQWRHVRLEIGGDDLIAAGVEQGPAVGRGLEAALAAKLDGEARGREQELAVALAAARA